MYTSWTRWQILVLILVQWAGVQDLAAQCGQVFFQNQLCARGFTDIRIAVN